MVLLESHGQMEYQSGKYFTKKKNQSYENEDENLQLFI